VSYQRVYINFDKTAGANWIVVIMHCFEPTTRGCEPGMECQLYIIVGVSAVKPMISYHNLTIYNVTLR